MSKFSIILPVRNGGDYVKECVNSILSQSYTDFNLHVLDNNSSDGTLQWIESLNDQRIILIPSPETLSIEENWNRIIGVAKNELMTLIGHDDILFPHYLSEMNRLINQYPDASLYQTHFSYIDAKGELLRKCKPMGAIEKAELFLSKVLDNSIDLMGTGFMMRSKDYDSIGGMPMYPNLLFADFELWINLARKTYKATSTEECFSFRLHQSTTTVSGDIKFQQAFEKFISFLVLLKNESDGLGKVIRQNGADFLLFYCKSLSHRLMRTPRTKRYGLSVARFINKCNSYATMLGVEDKFRPLRKLSIVMAKCIDSNFVTRIIFILFKKIYGKPILK